jgi:hypothetical protein
VTQPHVRGHADDVLVEAARSAELLVVGSRATEPSPDGFTGGRSLDTTDRLLHSPEEL